MGQDVVFQPVTLAASSADTDARLVFIGGQLAAVVVRLEDEIHGEGLQGTWFLESAFGDLAPLSGPVTFATLDEAADRISGLLQSRVGVPVALSEAGD